jgi:tetratricopeptide (TPR) repeat protein
MNLSPLWREHFEAEEIEAIHWSAVEEARRGPLGYTRAAFLIPSSPRWDPARAAPAGESTLLEGFAFSSGVVNELPGSPDTMKVMAGRGAAGRPGAGLAAWLGGSALALVACHGGPAEECERLFEAEEHERAAMHCEQVFEETGNPRSGALAAQAHHALGQHDEALAWLDRLRGSTEEALLWRLASRIHWQRGDGQRSREAAGRELELRREVGDHGKAADAAYALFYYNWVGGDYRAALAGARESFEEAKAAGDEALQVRGLQALQVVLYEVGDLDRAEAVSRAAAGKLGPGAQDDRARLMVYEGLILLNTGRPRLARDRFERALEVGAAIDEDAFFRSTHLNLAKANLELDDIDRAEGHLEAAWALADPEGRRVAALLFYRARILHSRGRHVEAAAVLDSALEQADDPAWARDLNHLRGEVAEAVEDLEEAEAAYGRAAEMVERMRESLGHDELKAWLLDRERRPLEALFRLQAQGGRNREALATFERAKARAFLDSLVDAATAAEAAENAEQLALTAEARLATLEALLPPLRDSAVTAVLPIDELLEGVGDRHLLLYFHAGDELWKLALVGRRLQATRLAASPAEIYALVHRYLADLEDVVAATALGEILLPGALMPPAGSTLHIVADGELGLLPFAALRRGDRYLIEDYTVVYTPSVNALVGLDRLRRHRYEPPFVLGDPLGDLPAAAVEAAQVAARLGVEALIGEAATLGSLIRSSRAELLHLATHSGLGAAGPWLTLSDHRVTADAVIAGQAAPRLVVLASCASATPRGRGVWGSLGTAFLAAGSQAVLGSLWSIEDAATRELVISFYQEGGATAPAEGLARAQRVAIAAGASPALWAPFVLLGSGEI